jgi:transketolase
MRDNFIKTLLEERSKDDSVMLLTGDLGFGVLEEFEELYPSSYLNLGIAEQTMTGIASGLALSGKRVLTYSIGNFPTLRCLEQIRNDLAYHECNVTIVAVGGGFSYGQLGMSHHATEDIGIMRALPNVEVLVPCTNLESELITKEVIASNKTSYLRLDKSFDTETDDTDSFKYGKLRRFRKGSKYVIIATGGILEEATKAADELKTKFNLNIKVLGCHMVKPFDEKDLINNLVDAEIILTLEEHNLVSGFGALIGEVLFRNKVQINHFINLGINDTYSGEVGDQKFLRNNYKINKEEIIKQLLNKI